MNLRKIECFIKVYEELNLSKAAQKLFITQQGLSRIIISMESDLGVRFFIRNTNGLTPTKFGDSFYYYACSIVKNLQHAQMELVKMKNSSQGKALHIGVSDGVFPSINLSKPLSIFKEKYPEIQILLITKADLVCQELLLNGEIDCSFQVGLVTDSNLQSTLLHQEPIYAWISQKHPVSRKKHISLEDLITQPLIMVDNQYSYHKLLNQWYNSKGLTYNIKYMTNDILTIYYLAAQNEVIALHPRYWQNFLVKDDSLVDLPVTDIDYSTWQVNLCRLNQPLTNVYEKLFIEFMINYYVSSLNK